MQVKRMIINSMTTPLPPTLKSIIILMAFCLMAGSSFAIEPTEQREWTSLAGTSLQATAISKEGEVITFQRPDKSTLKVKLSQLIPEHAQQLTTHFTEVIQSPQGLPHEIGKILGPLPAGNSKYFLYLPKSLVEGRPAPLLFFTGSGGGNAGSIRRHIEAAEILGWVVAASVESKNKIDGEPHVRACLAEIKATLPVDPKRIYYSGGSGGGQRALLNLNTFGGAGAMPVIAHGVGSETPKNKHYYYIGGATDYNRYGTAALRSRGGKNAFHRFHPLGHNMGPEKHANDGMIWLQGRFLENESRNKDFQEERLDYEAQVLAWLERIKEEQPARALLLTDFLLNGYKLEGINKPQAEALHNSLSSNENAANYLAGVLELDKLSSNELAATGIGSRYKHSSRDVTRKAKSLLKKYPSVDEVTKILENLQKKTS